MVFCESRTVGLIQGNIFIIHKMMIFQGFPNEEICKSKILDIVCAMGSFKNINRGTLKNGYRVMCEICFQHITDIVSAALKEKGEEEGGKYES
jgi:hypothetical protein